MLLMEEKFVEYLWEQGFFSEEDIVGKRCLIVGGEYLLRENYVTILNVRLMRRRSRRFPCSMREVGNAFLRAVRCLRGISMRNRISMPSG